MKPSKIKILIVGHKDFPFIKDEIYQPIQAGRSISKIKLPKPWIGDDTGENISQKNREYCELTAMYWAWKNYKKIGNPDYIGLCHYRRYFALKPRINKKNQIYSIIYFYGKKISDKLNLFFLIRKIYRYFLKKSISEEEQKKNFSEFEKNHLGEINKIKKIIEDYDIILPIRYEVPNPPIKNHYNKYGKVHEEDLKKLEFIIKKYFPKEKKYLSIVLKSKSAYFCNLFIMKKEVFCRYSKWLFEILAKVEDLLDLEKREGYDRRAIGLLGEILLNVWIEKNKKKYKIKEMPVISFN
ncbi:MAG: DUF4422 domain-containing protein [Candidatus Pacearchaeota archaeon]